MVRQGTWLVPDDDAVLLRVGARRARRRERDRKRAEVHGPSLQKALKAGVKIAFGTDAGSFPWTEPLAQEFACMVEVGMTPMAAIQSATSQRGGDARDDGDSSASWRPAPTPTSWRSRAIRSRTSKALEKVVFVMKDGKVYRKRSESPAR